MMMMWKMSKLEAMKETKEVPLSTIIQKVEEVLLLAVGQERSL